MSNDIFAKYPLRICGLGFAIGEALRYSYVLGIYPICGTMATTYIICHAVSQGLKGEKNFTIAAAETLIFDGLASYLIPSVIAYNVCRVTYDALFLIQGVPGVLMFTPTLVGLIVMLFTTKPIDAWVHCFLDKTVR